MPVYDPYVILGVSKGCSIIDAKQAYRKLASKHHPDKGGNEEVFKNIKEAFEYIERAGIINISAPITKSEANPVPSSFTSGKVYQPKNSENIKPAKGYEPKKVTKILPITRRSMSSSLKYEVHLEITKEQATKGCVIPFWHDGSIRDYYVRPGEQSHIRSMSYPYSEIIGNNFGSTIVIDVNLTVK